MHTTATFDEQLKYDMLKPRQPLVYAKQQLWHPTCQIFQGTNKVDFYLLHLWGAACRMYRCNYEFFYVETSASLSSVMARQQLSLWDLAFSKVLVRFAVQTYFAACRPHISAPPPSPFTTTTTTTTTSPHPSNHPPTSYHPATPFSVFSLSLSFSLFLLILQQMFKMCFLIEENTKITSPYMSEMLAWSLANIPLTDGGCWRLVPVVTIVWLTYMQVQVCWSLFEQTFKTENRSYICNSVTSTHCTLTTKSVFPTDRLIQRLSQRVLPMDGDFGN